MLKINKCHAFTLVELLIAISLSTIVMVVLVGGFFTVSRSWQAQEQILDNEIDNSLIRLEIEKALLGAFPYTYKEKKNKPKIFFKGKEQSLYFISTLSPSYNNQLTIWAISSLMDGGLSIQVSSALTGNPNKIIEKLLSSRQTKNKATEVLQDYKVTFEYLTQTPAGESNWLNKWNGVKKQSLPHAVRITLKLIDKEEHDKDKQTDQIVAFILANEHQTIKPKLK